MRIIAFGAADKIGLWFWEISPPVTKFLWSAIKVP